MSIFFTVPANHETNNNQVNWQGRASQSSGAKMTSGIRRFRLFKAQVSRITGGFHSTADAWLTSVAWGDFALELDSAYSPTPEYISKSLSKQVEPKYNR